MFEVFCLYLVFKNIYMRGLIVLVLLIISCDRKSLDEQRDNLDKDYILNKLDLQYY